MLFIGVQSTNVLFTYLHCFNQVIAHHNTKIFKTDYPLINATLRDARSASRSWDWY